MIQRKKKKMENGLKTMDGNLLKGQNAIKEL